MLSIPDVDGSSPVGGAVLSAMRGSVRWTSKASARDGGGEAVGGAGVGGVVGFFAAAASVRAGGVGPGVDPGGTFRPPPPP